MWRRSKTISTLNQALNMDNKKPPIIIGVLRNALVFTLFFLAVFSLSAQNPNIKCYFNRTVNTNVSIGTNAVYLNTTFVDTAVAYINRSKYTLDVCMYNYTYNSGDGLDAIATAINNAYNRGVVIRWIYDGSSTNSGLTLLNSNIYTLGSPTTFSYGIMHNKFMAIDVNSSNAADAIVWTGSFNFSRAQSDVDYNNILIVQDKPLALAYYAEFNKMWGGTGVAPNLSTSKFGPFKTSSSQTSYTVNGTPIEVSFSPEDNTASRIINSINTCNSDLFFGIYTFTDTMIANRIKSAKNSGKSVRGIMDSYSQSFTPYSTLSPIMGSDLRIYSSSGTYHNKTILVDAQNTGSDPQTITGSHNWSISADTKNDENTLIVHDAVVTNQYYQSFCKNFTDLGGAACAMVGIESFDQGERQVIVFPNPADDAVTVKVKNAGLQLKVQIEDMLGHIVFGSAPVTNDEVTLDVSTLPAGMYFVRIERGDRVFTEKLIRK